MSRWASTPVSDELLSKLLNVSASELPEELRHYEIDDVSANDVRYLSVPVGTNDVCTNQIRLDASGIPAEELQDTQLYLLLLGQLDTYAHSKEELSALITRYLGTFSAGLTAEHALDGSSDLYYAKLSFTNMGETAKNAAELLQELLFDTDFSDVQTMKGFLKRSISDFKNATDNMPIRIQLSRCKAMFSQSAAFSEYVQNYAFSAYLQDMAELADKDPAALCARLTNAGKKLLNKNGALMLSAGGAAAISAYQTSFNPLFSAMTSETREKADYSSLLLPKRNEAVINNSTVQMNLQFHAYTGYSGKDDVITMLINDLYLLPQLRNALGAYGAYSTSDREVQGLYTYRDPNLSSSYEIFAALPDYLRSTALTQEQVNSYITGAYSSLSRPKGQLSDALLTMSNSLIGLSEEARLQLMRDAKATNVADVQAAADSFQKLMEEGVCSSSGTEGNLLESSKLFDVMLYPDSTEKQLKH